MEIAQYPCLCAMIRKAGRIVTRQYDIHLKPSGLKVTQYSMLANISRNPAVSVSELADLLIMDQTTVSRNLQVLEKAGFINLEMEDEDHRIRRIRLTELGLEKMKEARPLWEKAQSDMEGVLGREGVDAMLGSFIKMME